MNNEQVLAALDACLAVLYEVIAEDIPAKLDTEANKAIDAAEEAKKTLVEGNALPFPPADLQFGPMGYVYQYKPTVGEFPPLEDRPSENKDE